MMDAWGAILETMLPGDEAWPSGRTVLPRFRQDLVAAPDAMAAMETLSLALPPGFRAGDEGALRAIEAAHPAEFERVVTLAYIAYYTDQAVRQTIERVTGYEARPPQPLGYELPPFDETLLAVQRQRAPFWRDPDAETGR